MQVFLIISGGVFGCIGSWLICRSLDFDIKEFSNKKKTQERLEIGGILCLVASTLIYFSVLLGGAK